MSLRDLLISSTTPLKANLNAKTPLEAKKVIITPTDEIGDTPLSEGLAAKSKKIAKFKRDNYKEAELLYIGYPRKREKNHCRRRFSTTVDFKVNGQKRQREILFGKEGKEEFVDHKDESRRLNTITKTGNHDNWLHPNFYKIYLLNSKHDNISDAYRDLVSSLNLTTV